MLSEVDDDQIAGVEKPSTCPFAVGGAAASAAGDGGADPSSSDSDSETSLGSQSSTTKLAQHKVISFCFKMVCSIPGFDFKPVLYRGEDAVAVLYRKLKKTKKIIDRLTHMNVPILMGPDDWKDFRKADKCVFL
jgi:hypothetical protein